CLERKKGKVFWTVHDYDAARAVLQRAEQLLGPFDALVAAEARHEWIEVQQGLFWLYYYARRAGAETEQLIQRTERVVEAHGTPVQRSMFYECAASDLMARRRYAYSD